MDPVIDNEWLGYKNDPIDEAQNVSNIVRSWQWREYGINQPNTPSNKTVLENMAEDILVRKPLKIRCCDLPGYPRSTFLMVFSPDGTKVASTHGNHNVYVSELASGKHVRILKGHPRTPWCIAFHPSHPQLIGSGCLGGQVRVWDISSGGSEVWSVRNETVIASIAFHPREQLLVIATYNELYFWNWSQPAPFNKVSTNNINEKVRYVAFDALGYKLITGISLWSSPSGGPPTVVQPNGTWGPPNTTNNNRRDDFDESPSNTNRPQDNSGSAQDMIVNSYQNLVQRYDSLVRNYQRLFMVRHRLISIPPPPNMIDRGTDPMETDFSSGTSSWTRMARSSTSTASLDRGSPTPGPSHRQDGGDNTDGEGNSSRLLNLDVLSFNSNPNRNEEGPPQEHSIFGSRSSAFQPLTDSGRSFRPVDQSERTTRLLPNPFSSSSGITQTNRNTFPDNPRISPRNFNMNTSRTSIFTSSRPENLSRDFARRRRNSSPSQITSNLNRPNNSSNLNDDGASTSTARPLSILSSSILENLPSTSRTTSHRPTMTNSSTQMSPVSAPMNQTINESLNLIRDILRDSGTRLLNLITNMSLSTLASVERNIPRRGTGSRTHSDDSEGTNRSRGIRPRVRLFSSSLRRDFLSSSSDSDSDQSLEVNIFRTRNSTFREDDSREDDQPSSASTNDRVSQPTPTDRMVFELGEETHNEGAPRETNGINVSMSNSRFRVRTQNNSATDDPQPSTSTSTTAQDSAETHSQNNSDFNPDRPSTSRDNSWTRGGTIPPEEAYRKVRGGVGALQRHTMQLTNIWLRGTHVSMRELRTMWENLRRRILTLHRETGRQDLPSYTRSFLERCMMLIEMSDNITRTNRPTRNQRNEESDRTVVENRNESGTTTNASPGVTEGENNASTENNNESRQLHGGRSTLTRSSGIRSSPSLRRRLQSSYRWRPEDEIRRRSRNPSSNRWAPRYSNRSRRDFARAIEFSATRLEIRMRAMQILSVMFKTMMMCLKERGLSQLIINMLRTLKKALALTGLMLMANRGVSRANNPSQRVESMNVVRIENVEHPGPVNVDEPDESSPPHIPNPEDERLANSQNESENVSLPQTPIENEIHSEPSTSNITNIQRWSNRLAVQIAAANRNTSITARTRRDLYIESKRQKALHRTNPIAHPLTKKRVLPPVSTYRIPALRSWATKTTRNKTNTASRRPEPCDEPVAGPSTASPPVENSNPDSPRSEVINEFEHRVNLIRIAHMQAIRLRNAARNRFRRLQTIRLYTPSSVREMFALQTNNGDSNPSGSRAPLQSGSEMGNRRPFATYRPHILTPRSESTNRASEEPGQFHAVLNNVAMPLMQVNDLPLNPDAPGNQQQRLPRIHEYLQPIILAQNAMLDDEAGGDGGGGAGGGGGGAPRRMSGMAGLFDATNISEALPAPSHRVQAWDFTTGDTPDIADSTKNVVVQKCRIHNDASIDISKDGRLLVALLPVPRLRNTNHWLGVYSLEWSRLGQCLHTAVLEQNAVSVALSPTARHLAVGLGSRRFTTTPHGRNNVFALLYRLEPIESSSRTGLSPIKELEQNWEHGFTSLNCLRWAPQPGQGLVYANNTGQLIIMS